MWVYDVRLVGLRCQTYGPTVSSDMWAYGIGHVGLQCQTLGPTVPVLRYQTKSDIGKKGRWEN